MDGWCCVYTRGPAFATAQGGRQHIAGLTGRCLLVNGMNQHKGSMVRQHAQPQQAANSCSRTPATPLAFMQALLPIRHHKGWRHPLWQYRHACATRAQQGPKQVPSSQGTQLLAPGSPVGVSSPTLHSPTR